MPSAQGNETGVDAADPFAAARATLFPPLQNRALAQAVDALAASDLENAERRIADHLRRHPRDAAALNLKADVARRARRFEEAEQLLSRCVSLSPTAAGYRFNYAVLLRRREKYSEALAQLDALLGGDPRNPLYRDQKAAVLRLLGRYDEALEYRRGLVDDYPGAPDVWLHYAHALRGVGRQEECIAAYSKALALAPSMVAVYSHLSDLKTYRFTDDDIAHMEKHLARGGLSTEERGDLSFALGKAYGDRSSFAKSFDAYAKGNALRRIGREFDPARLTAFSAACEAIFTPEFYRERTGWGSDSRAPIFIVGMPRSGSTLIEQILSSHSAIEGLGELTELDNAVADAISRREDQPAHQFWIGGWFEFRKRLVEAFPDFVRNLSAADCQALGDAYLQAVRPRRTLGLPFFSDKALRNFGYTGLIHLILPNAKIVDARRHPLDCGWSCFKSHFPGGQPFADRLPDIGSHYASYVRLMAHFDRALPGLVHRVIYEDLVANPDEEIRRLFAYLEIPFEEQCLRFYENKRAVGTLSSEQVRMPLYKTGKGQWRHYEQWLGPLKAALGPVLDQYPNAPHA